MQRLTSNWAKTPACFGPQQRVLSCRHTWAKRHWNTWVLENIWLCQASAPDQQKDHLFWYIWTMWSLGRSFKYFRNFSRSFNYMSMYIYIDTLSGLEFCERRNAVNSINDSIAKPGALQGALQRPSVNHSNCPNLSSLTGPSFMDTFEIRLHISHQIVGVNVPWCSLRTFEHF